MDNEGYNQTTLIEKQLIKLSKEELISKINSLTLHNEQLKNIISKQNNKEIMEKNNKPFNFDRCIFRHILIKFLYLGWNYSGYAVQEDTNETVENYLFKALVKTCLIKCRSDSNYHRCGRTDKGVSSCGQVISIDVRSRLSVENLHKLDEEIDYCLILNKVLPDDIQCIAWSPVNNNFSARFDCKGRTYKYIFPKGQLDIQKMEKASKYLLGTHDFRNFCKMDVGNGVTKFIRNITNIEIDLLGSKSRYIDEYTMHVITITGQAFLWHQIRCIMGILFLVGESKEEPEIIKGLLDVTINPRKPDYNMASEIPLNLYNCLYEDDYINWQYNENVVNNILGKLNEKYTFSSIQSGMIKTMIDDIKQNIRCNSSTSLPQFLLQGTKSKIYTPVMKRQKCDSLEKKLKQFAKRKKQFVNN